MRRTASVIAVLATLFGGSLVTAPTAAAAYTREWDSATSDNWVNGKAWCMWRVPDTPAVGCWFPQEDDLQIADTASDSKRVGLQWKTDYGRFGVCVQSHGADSYLDGGAFQVGNYSCHDLNLAEGHTITFRVGTCDGSKADCGVLANWSQWSAWSEPKPT